MAMDVFVYVGEGGEINGLTHSRRTSPNAFSPDGKDVLFSSMRLGDPKVAFGGQLMGASIQLYSIPATGSGVAGHPRSGARRDRGRISWINYRTGSMSSIWSSHHEISHGGLFRRIWRPLSFSWHKPSTPRRAGRDFSESASRGAMAVNRFIQDRGYKSVKGEKVRRRHYLRRQTRTGLHRRPHRRGSLPVPRHGAEARQDGMWRKAQPEPGRPLRHGVRLSRPNGKSLSLRLLSRVEGAPPGPARQDRGQDLRPSSPWNLGVPDRATPPTKA